MSIISTLTLRHLKENMKRTIVTILGIAASTALITAILVGIFSFFGFFGYINKLTDGNVHADFDDITWEDAKALKNDDRIEIAGITCSDPTITGVRMINDRENRFRVGNIFNGDNDIYRQLVISDYEGSLPESSQEVAVEEDFLKDNGLDLHVGDKITFELGNRYEIEPDGNIVYYGGSYRSEEKFEVLSTEECTITAILHGNRPTKDFDMLRGFDFGTPVRSNDKGQPYLHCRITLRNPNYTSAVQIKQIAADHGLHINDMNTEFLISVFAIQGMGGAYTQMFGIMLIALLIVVVTSVVLIYNAFGMSLAEKIRYLGMLASVGATRAQKRASIYFEGLVLGIIGVPLGILAGIIGAAVTLDVLGKRVLEADIITGAEGLRGGIPILVTMPAILVIIAVSAITIFISALVPAIKASRIMPLDALRQTNTVKYKGSRLRVNPLIRKLFGYEGELAYKNIKRNGFKGTVIVFSMAISIIMFLTIDFFNNTFMKLNQYEIDIPFDIYVSCALDEKDRLKAELEALPEVTRAVPADHVAYAFRSNDEDDKDFVPVDKSFLNPDCLTADYKTLFDNVDAVLVVEVDDNDFDEFLKANGISPDDYHGKELKGVILDSYLHTENGKPVFTDRIVGQKLFYEDSEGNPPAVEIAAIVPYAKDNYICNMVPKNTIDVYVPASMYFEKAQEHLNRDALSYNYGLFTVGNTEGLRDRISDLTTYGEYHNCVVSDISQARDAMDAVSLMLTTAMYGFTILLTLIAIANIVNTISTAIQLRRQEFAMFRSVGMEEKGIKKMLLLETALYGLRALIIGMPISALISYLMFGVIESKVFAFELNYPMYLIVLLGVFAIIGLSMLLSAGRIKDDNIIEALKIDMA